MISAQLGAIEAQLIPGDLASKIAMGEEDCHLLSSYLGVGVSTIENSCSTIEHN